MSDIRKIAGFTVEDLCALEGIGEKTAQKIVCGANKFLEENPGYGNKTAPSAAPKVLENKEVQENESKETESK
jgi:Holliday junction resolvasome RuvABC DNA-binding subunit